MHIACLPPLMTYKQKGVGGNAGCANVSWLCPMQEDVYEEIAPLVRSCVDGFNTCIFAYGQTGSGVRPPISGFLLLPVQAKRERCPPDVMCMHALHTC